MMSVTVCVRSGMNLSNSNTHSMMHLHRRPALYRNASQHFQGETSPLGDSLGLAARLHFIEAEWRP